MAAPETIRVRDLNMDDVKLFTPVTAPLTQNTMPLTSDTAHSGYSVAPSEDDLVPLSEFYTDDNSKSVEFGCECLDPNEILFGRELIGHGASSQVHTRSLVFDI